MDTPVPAQPAPADMPLTIEQQAARRQEMVNALFQQMTTKQATRPLQGRAVGGFYVPPSPVQGLSNLGWGAASAYARGRQGNASNGLFGMGQQPTAPTRTRTEDTLWNSLQPVGPVA